MRTTGIADAILRGLTLPEHRSGYFTVDSFTVPAMRRRFEENDLGKVAPASPGMVAYAPNDEIMPNAMGLALYADYRRLGVDAHFTSIPLGEHLSGAAIASPHRRNATCGQLNVSSKRAHRGADPPLTT